MIQATSAIGAFLNETACCCSTANFIPIDHKTDATIQLALRHKLPSDVTVITIAHRLRTVVDVDRIVSLFATFVENETSSDLLPFCEAGPGKRQNCKP